MLKMKPVICLFVILALCMGLFGGALAEAAPAEAPEPTEIPLEAPADAAAPVAPEASAAPLTNETVLATVNGQDITYADVRPLYDMLQQSYASQMDVSDPSMQKLLKEVAINYAVMQRALMNKAKEQGLDQFTDEEGQQIQAQADEAYQQASESCRSMFAADGKDEAQLQTEIDAFLASNGYTKDILLEQLRINAISQRLLASVSDAVAVTDEQLRQLFDAKVAEQQAAYDANAAQFDRDTMQGAAIYYTPEGVRAVKHILVMLDQATATQLKALHDQLAALPEDDAGRADIQKQIDTLMMGTQLRLDEIEQKLAAGEDFNSLIDLYGEDPGMQPGSPYRETGYYLAPGDTSFEQPFALAALALAKPGDVSEPVLASRGFHIIRYDHDVPAGVADFEQIKESLRAQELQNAKKKAESDAAQKWVAESTVETFPERFT